MTARLNRQVFTTSRELEYFSESELVTQTGHHKEDWWPGVIAKELIDNALDACEQASVPPDVRISFDGSELAVTDNGPGIPSAVIGQILDFSTRTSDKAAYVSPTRGAQGNALKTVLTIPFVLNGGKPATIEVEAQGVKHVVIVQTDHIARRPAIDHQVVEFVKTEGTTIRLKIDAACLKQEPCDRRFLQDEEEDEEEQDAEPQCLQHLVQDYALFNPHAAFLLSQYGKQYRFEATAPDWKKWLPTDPTSCHWYSAEQFEDLVASYIAVERTGTEPRTVRSFIAEFRGLSSSAKQKKISTAAHLERSYLHDLVIKKGQLNNKAVIRRLLEIMQRSSAPVKPEALGILGEAHFRARLAPKLVKTERPTRDSACLKEGVHEQQFLQEKISDEKTFRYKKLSEINEQGLPCVVEVAFALTDDPSLRGVHFGLNWSSTLGNPLQEDRFGISNDDSCYGFSALLEKARININRDPVALIVHLICPRFNFLDRGKGSVAL